MSVTLDRICTLIGADVPADAREITITGIASLTDAGDGDLSFLSNPRYTRHLAETRAAAVIVGKGADAPAGTRALVVDDPYLAFTKVLALFDPRSPDEVASGIDPNASIAPDAVLGKDVAVGPFAVIGSGAAVGDGTVIGPLSVVMAHARVGAGCLLYPGVKIMDRCQVGDRVIIHAGAVIGSDGFGFAPGGGGLAKIPQIGIVRLEDDVEIGANTCIDRAAFGETVIGAGTKLDNLVQIAHNAKVGRSTVIAAQSGVSGSTTIGSGVQVGGQVGFAGHIGVGDGVSVGAQAGVTKDVEAGQTVSGYPAKRHMDAMRQEAALRRLPELLKTIARLEDRIAQLEKTINQREDTHAG